MMEAIIEKAEEVVAKLQQLKSDISDRENTTQTILESLAKFQDKGLDELLEKMNSILEMADALNEE